MVKGLFTLLVPAIFSIVLAIRTPEYELPKLVKHPKHRHHHIHHHETTSSSSSVSVKPEVLPSEETYICQDSNFYIDTSIMKTFEKSEQPCPKGYQLAQLSTPAIFNQAAMFVFGCLGPAKEVWISSAMGTIYGEGDPVKLISPDAIEKGGLPFGTQQKAKSLSKSHKVPDTPIRRINVRSVGNVELDQTDITLPFLCQAIVIEKEEETVAETRK